MQSNWKVRCWHRSLDMEDLRPGKCFHALDTGGENRWGYADGFPPRPIRIEKGEVTRR